ncbi:MAG: SAM-dependent methyltransferase [Chloroflexi bacterium AL-W]|nr:SAM-dependent methyltransferase [Chloroflexi bacterium AL-N1]NOK64906.1 SAM-dependent methyltransferase [Chloroflexi bacterium AL-N10]NOK76676.1 SAM-dependent methyltransferase [Chloroflexi bacterium AL-N5]NOK84567.1 SAM-dependent methyltransferase [Chloroflexi bacterium AL-W]NOK86608.1 SAM-dependent methyltransferase [Chloroflexi bacterium AL-N15]
MIDGKYPEYTDAELYDAENVWNAADTFYLELAQTIGGPVLDVACGTGRLTRAIAEAGLSVVGTDTTREMLSRARVLANHLPITWVEADCRTMDLGQRFQFILMTGHAFQHLLIDADQDAFLSCAVAHLEEGGTLAFETRNLQGKNYGASADFTRWRSFHDKQGRFVAVDVASTFDPVTAIDDVQVRHTTEGTDEVRISRTRLRYTAVELLNQRLNAHGLTIVSQYGDWTGMPVSANSSEIITICRYRGD